jgi:hypothetical protein
MINRRFDARTSCLAQWRAMPKSLEDKQGISVPAA